MENKIRVYGKAQNRTALGVMTAYMIMHPEATLDELRRAFPDSLNPDSGVKNNFVEEHYKGTTANWEGYFRADDELLTMGDGTRVAVVSMWTKASLNRLIEHARQYGIEVMQVDAIEGAGRKGGFRLEFLNGYTPHKAKKEQPEPAEEKPRNSKKWLWAVLAVIVVAAIAGALYKNCQPKTPETIIVRDTVETEKIVYDTVYVEQVAEIQDKFNAAQFDKDKAELNDDAKFALHDLASLMKRNPELKLRIEGHTSSEGDSLHNLKLSEARAKAAVDFLVHREGIDSTRLQAVGKGSSEPIDPDNLEANRRTEFKIIK